MASDVKPSTSGQCRRGGDLNNICVRLWVLGSVGGWLMLGMGMNTVKGKIIKCRVHGYLSNSCRKSNISNAIHVLNIIHLQDVDSRLRDLFQHLKV